VSAAASRVYRTVDGRLVWEGDPEAAFLAYAAGDEFTAEDEAALPGSKSKAAPANKSRPAPADKAADRAAPTPEEGPLMARYRTSISSQTTMLSGAPSGTTVNGYIGYWGGSATSGYRLRRLFVGLRAGASVPTSQQVSVQLHRQTVAPAGTGLAAAVLGQPMETWTPQTDPTVGMIATTATTIGTTGPTISATALANLTFNSQNTIDMPMEFLEELVCAIGTANGIAFVNSAATLPPSHFITIDAEIEV
jgi:hypothetical protein